MQVGSVQSSLNAGLQPLKRPAEAATRTAVNTAANTATNTAANTAGGAATSVYIDPRDTNQDGIVSPAEITAYELRHPSLKPAHAAHADVSGYTHQGLRQQIPQALPGRLDLKA